MADMICSRPECQTTAGCQCKSAPPVVWNPVLIPLPVTSVFVGRGGLTFYLPASSKIIRTEPVD